MSRFLLFLGLFLTITVVKAQDEFGYGIKYNDTTNAIDAYAVFTKGNDLKDEWLTSSEARFTIVLPADSELSIIKSYNPVDKNNVGESWILGDVINKPKASPSLSFHEVELFGTGNGKYPRFLLNKPVRLFSFKVTLGSGCIDAIRIFDNVTDPKLGAGGMKSKEFKNYFSLGNAGNVYWKNVQLETGLVIKNEKLGCTQDLVNYQLLPANGSGDGFWQIASTNTTFSLDTLSGGKARLNANAGNDVKSIIAVYNEGNGNEFVCLTIPAQRPKASLESICIGDTTRISTYGNGSWVSNNTAVATITPEGKITGVSTGTTTFTFTSAIGCVAVESQPLMVASTIDAKIYPSKGLCPNGQVILTAESNNGSAYLWATGQTTPSIVVATPGLISVTVVSSGGCSAVATLDIKQDTFPIVSFEKTFICRGNTTQATSSVANGTWSSLLSYIAKVDRLTGLVTGLGQNEALIGFTPTNTGCTGYASLIVNSTQHIYAADEQICVGGKTFLQPNQSNGTWLALDPQIASINDTIVTGIATGTARFIFKENLNECESDTVSIFIRPQSVATISGPTSICIGGTTTLSPSVGGTWSSSNGAVAAVTNSGLITGLSAGTATFTFTDASIGCISDPTGTLTVNSNPTVSLSAASSCVGITRTATASPSVGSWVSNNPTVATINATTGVITPNNQGQTTFTFTATATGCNRTSLTFIVNPPPTVSVSRDTICVGNTTTLSPTTGGTWAAMNSSIASLSNGGIVTGVSEGMGRFRFTQSVTGCQAFDTVIIQARPVITNGAAQICVGGSTNLLPNSGGSWQTSNGAIATISNTGLVTGVSIGNVVCEFTSNAGCTSLPSAVITVNNAPIVSLQGPPFLCQASTRQLSPSTGGTWTSNNPAVASITPLGLVTAVGPGAVNFTFIQSGSQCNATTNNMIVNPNPVVSIDKDTICAGTTAIITPSTGGTYSLLTSPLIATFSNTGVITGIFPGIAVFQFTETLTGCQANDTLYIKSGPMASVDGLAIICPGKNARLLPNSGGTWVSNHPLIATVNPTTGVVTGNAQGTASFSRTDNATGCISDPVTITVLNKIPTSSTAGQYMCVGGTINLMPNIGGTWTNNAPAVATVSGNGLVNGLSEGTVAFEFNASNGCPSDPIIMLVNGEKQKITFNGPTIICPGGFTQINSFSDRYIVIDKNIIDTFTGNGLIKGIAPGKVRITLDPASGCTSDTVVVTVENFSSPKLVFDNYKTIENQDSLNIMINEVSGLIVPIEITPIPNAHITGQKHRNATSNILIDDVLVNLSNIPQIAQYIIKSTIPGVPIQECHNIDTLHVWVRPILDQYRVRFIAFADENGDNIFNQNTENALSGVLIRVDDLNLTQITDAVGQAIFIVDGSGSQYKASINYGAWQDSVIMGTIQSNDLESTIYLPFHKSNLYKQAVVTYSSNLLRCSTDIRSYASIINTGTSVISGQLVMIYNDRVKVNGASKPFIKDGSTIAKWTVNQLATGKSWNTEIGLTIPNANNNNDSLVFELYFVEANGDTLSLDRYAEIIRCSYDPNDKQSWPDRIGDDNLTLRTETLKYQIRFQNTGNDTAFVVRIQDVLDRHLDLNTLLITNSSHDVRTEIYGDTVQFVFENIRLVDSTTNPLLSQGFVSFRIDEYRDIPNGTEIFNQVGIYFDKNDPIITNTVKNTIVNHLPCPLNAIWSVGDTLYVNAGEKEYAWYDCETDTLVAVSQNPFFKPEKSGKYYAKIKGNYCTSQTSCLIISSSKEVLNVNIKISPNPVSDYLRIISSEAIDAFKIFNALGENVHSEHLAFPKDQIEVSTESLNAGIYFIECKMQTQKVLLKFVKF